MKIHIVRAAILALLAGCSGAQVTPGPISERGAADTTPRDQTFPPPIQWREASLNSFDFTDGAYNTYAGLVFDAAGNLYGTTQFGGETICDYIAGCGVVFELMRAASGRWQEKVLHRFSQCDSLGFWPRAGLTIDAKGNLYGTTDWGGPYCDGVGPGAVYELSPHSGGQWTESVVYQFKGGVDGSGPQAALTLDALGDLYGTTSEGGHNDNGTVFELTRQSNGKWLETILHFFKGDEGNGPASKLTFDKAGDLYGTTGFGGAYRSACGIYGCGTAFQLKRGANGLWTLKVLHRFGKAVDGAFPDSTLTVDSAGNLFGVAAQGGPRGSLVPRGCLTSGCGTVFKLSRHHDKWTEQTIHGFGSATDGNLPRGDLLLSGGALYGTTVLGGLYGNGTAFRLTPHAGKWEEQVLHDFGNGRDGSLPYTGMIFDQAHNLYGTTDDGGAYQAALCRKSHGCGTVFELSSARARLLHASYNLPFTQP
ncbi:MAG TPA: choice-of-anchor tandem repeat GloVer-containing protein [Candidatus Cybelea sp.]